MKSELSNVSFLAIPSGSHLAGEQGLWKMLYDGTSSAVNKACEAGKRGQ